MQAAAWIRLAIDGDRKGAIVMRVLVGLLVLMSTLVISAAAGAQTGRGGQMTGTFSASTGGHVDEESQPVKILSGPGPYSRTILGTGPGLDPKAIEYVGQRLGLPVNRFPADLVIEFCEWSSVNEALLKDRCPTFAWTLDRTVEISANYEPIKSEEADRNWFTPSKKYVLIWRDRNRVVKYSTPITFGSR
jgi:hypothetical protein